MRKFQIVSKQVWHDEEPFFLISRKQIKVDMNFHFCSLDPCILRPDGYNYTTLRLLDEQRCDQFYTCLGGHTKKLCTCGERLVGDILVHKKYDPLSDHCVDDWDGECFTIIDPGHQKVTTPGNI